MNKDSTETRRSKAIEVGFWPLPPGSPPTEAERKYLPEKCALMDIDLQEAMKVTQAALDAAKDPSWKTDHPDEYAAVVAYLSHPEEMLAYHGSSYCRVCGITNGSHDYLRGPFVYPEGYSHYITQHGFKPPQEVIDAAVAAGGVHPLTRDEIGDRLRVLGHAEVDTLRAAFSMGHRFTVRLYDGFDHQWIDVLANVPLAEAFTAWMKETKDGTKNTRFDHIDYYRIFPADTRMLYS